jgi:hypothetical protein
LKSKQYVSTAWMYLLYSLCIKSKFIIWFPEFNIWELWETNIFWNYTFYSRLILIFHSSHYITSMVSVHWFWIMHCAELLTYPLLPQIKLIPVYPWTISVFFSVEKESWKLLPGNWLNNNYETFII